MHSDVLLKNTPTTSLGQIHSPNDVTMDDDDDAGHSRCRSPNTSNSNNSVGSGSIVSHFTDHSSPLSSPGYISPASRPEPERFSDDNSSLDHSIDSNAMFECNQNEDNNDDDDASTSDVHSSPFSDFDNDENNLFPHDLSLKSRNSCANNNNTSESCSSADLLCSIQNELSKHSANISESKFFSNVELLSKKEGKNRKENPEKCSSNSKRGILPKQATSIMRTWLFQHIVVSRLEGMTECFLNKSSFLASLSNGRRETHHRDGD